MNIQDSLCKERNISLASGVLGMTLIHVVMSET